MAQIEQVAEQAAEQTEASSSSELSAKGDIAAKFKIAQEKKDDGDGAFKRGDTTGGECHRRHMFLILVLIHLPS